MYHFFAMLSRMKFINRWGLMRNTKTENLSEHSFDVAVLAHALVVIHNKISNNYLSPEKAATLALFHDVTEIITGDMPTPIKYYSKDIRKAYTIVEDMAQNKLLSMLPEDVQEDYAPLICENSPENKDLIIFVKAADKLSALIKCIEETKSGNTEFIKAEKTISDALKEMDLPEVDFYIKNYLPSYRLTLDEQE